MTTDQLKAWLEKNEKVHPNEIGLRVGQAISLISELLALRELETRAKTAKGILGLMGFLNQLPEDEYEDAVRLLDKHWPTKKERNP